MKTTRMFRAVLAIAVVVLAVCVGDGRAQTSPTLTTDGGATVGIGTATLRGLMTAGGTATATICWGAEPGDTVDGADTGTWDFVSAAISVTDNVAFSNAVSNLYYGIDYEYAVYATNSYGEDWSSVTNFTTLALTGSPFYQDFEGGGTPYTLTQLLGSTPPELRSDGGVGITNYLRLITTVGNTRNEIAFDQTSDQVSPGDSTSIGFDFRMAGTADGWGLTLIPTSTYGTSGAGAPNAAEEPNVAGAIAIGFDIYGENHVSLHWNGSALDAVDPPSFNLNEDKWHHGKVELVDPGPASDVTLTFTLTPDIHGTPGTPFVVWDSYTVTGLSALYSYRVQCQARTGGANHRTDLDNFQGPAVAGISIDNTIATDITDSTADLLGTLDAPQSVFTVSVYWSTSNNLTEAEWLADGTASNAVVGTFTNVVGQSLSNHVEFLSAATTTYYTYMATNAATNIWASPNGKFDTDDPSTAPTLDPSGFVDDRGGDAVRTNVLVMVTVTFSKPMNAATVTSNDFGNAGNATITVGTVVQTGPAVFEVPVTATSGGTLRLKVNQDAVLEDMFNNPLDTSSAIADDTIIMVDVIAPTIVPPTAPADDATDVTWATELVATFSESIAAASGNIVITNLTDGTATTIDVTDGTQVTVSGTTLTIDPTGALLSGKEYAILIDNGAVVDAPAGNPFAGITSTNDWNFTTKAVVLLAHYPFDADFTDAYGTNNLVISSGTPIITTTAGTWKFGGGAAYFDGSSTLDVAGGYTFSFSGTTPWSVSFWVRRDAIQTSYPIQDVGGSGIFWLRSNQNFVYFNNNQNDVGNGIGDALTYRHWVLVADGGGNLTVYKNNGVSYANSPVGGTAFNINQVGAGGGSAIDDLAIFDGALTPAQVADLYNNGLDFPDVKAPTVDMLVPADGVTVATPTALTVTFSEDITTNTTGSITLTNITVGTADIIPVGSGELVVSGADLIITPTNPVLAHGSQYAVLISTNAIQDLAGNVFAGYTNTAVWDWTFTTTTPQSPTLTPDGGATVGIGTATLRGLMTAGGTATATICWGAEPGDTVDGADTGTWDFVSAAISVSDHVAFSHAVSNLYYGIEYDYAVYATNSYGEAWSSVTNFTTTAPQGISVTNTCAVNVTDTEVDLLGTLNATQSVFTVRVYWSTNDHTTSAQWVGDTTASNAVVGSFTNVVGQSLSNHVEFLSAATTYTYTYMATNVATNIWASPNKTFDTDDPSTAPTLDPSGFVDDRGGDAVRTNVLVMVTVTFSKPMNAGTVTSNDFGNAGNATITVGSVVQTGPTVFEVPVTATSGGTLRLQVNQDAVLEDMFNNPLDTSSAIADDTIITVDVIAPAIVLPTAPADNATDVGVGTHFVASFSENIAVGSGNIVITNLTDGTATTIAVTDGTQVTVSGTTLTIDATAALLSGKKYAILIDSGAVTDDPAGNPFAGITSPTVWNVKTKAVVLLAYYPFDTDFTDALGDNDLTAGSGSPAITNEVGTWKFGGGAAYFDGSSYLDFSAQISFGADHAWSVSFWYVIPTDVAGRPLEDSTAGPSQFWYRGGNPGVYVYSGGPEPQLRVQPSGQNSYHHMVFVSYGDGYVDWYYNNVSLAPYFDKEGQSLDSMVAAGHRFPFTINRTGAGGPQFLDDLAIFDGALNPDQVAELINGLDFDEWKPPPPGILLIVR